MFGAKGGRFQSLVGKGPEGLRCTCRDHGFGSVGGASGGMMKSSPSMSDILDLLQYYRAQHRDASSDSEKRHQCMRNIDSILRELSANIWKCFHVPFCIHPYSATTLADLKVAFAKQAILPTITDEFAETGGIGNDIGIESAEDSDGHR